VISSGKTGHCSRLIFFIALLALFSNLSACRSAAVPSEELSGPAALKKISATVSLQRQWSARIGSGQGALYNRLTPAIDGERIFVASADGRVACYHLSGERCWSLQLKEALSAGVGAAYGVVAVATEAGDIVALSREHGGELWRVSLAAEVLAAPQVSRQHVLLQTHDGRLLALNIKNGEMLWAYRSDLPRLILRGTATPVIDNEAVYSGFASGKLVALNLVDGRVLWNKTVAIARGQAELERMVDIDAPPLVTEDRIYSNSLNGSVLAISKRRAKALWRFDSSSYRALAAGFGNIYLVDENSRLYAIDEDSGEQRWQQSALLHRQLSAPTVFSGFLVVADDQGYLHVISQVDGALVGRVRVDKSGVRSVMQVVGEQLYVYSNSGLLASFSLQNR